MAERTDILELSSISKSFSKHRILGDLNLSLKSGEVALLLGANGAGKSTLLRICSGLLRADAGKVSAPAINKIGYLGHATQLYSAFSIEENLSFIADLSGRSQDIEETLSAWGLLELRSKPVSELSRGMQLRASIVRTLMTEPRLILLDEPSSSLDDAAFDLVAAKIKQHASLGAGALIATHDIARFSALASRVLILEEGKIARDSSSKGTKEELYAHYQRVNR